MGAMAAALEDAGEPPDAVDYINAHGTSTELNDAAETRAITKALGDHAQRVAGLLDQVDDRPHAGRRRRRRGVRDLAGDHRGVIPPTINYRTPDPECDLDYVPNEARTAEVRFALSNSFGFGGQNAVVAARRFEG